jgi:hypothetical protein
MFAAALFASLLLQAEQAPTPTAGPAEPAPGPAEPAPRAAGALPAPPAPPPPPKTAQPASPPVVAEPEPQLPANSVSVHVRYAYRVGAEGDTVVPAAGMSLGGEFERRLAAFQNGFELGLAVDFFYDRFSKDVIATTSQGQMIASQTLSQTSFALMETTAWRYADMRLFAGIGAGFGIGFFAGPELSPNSKTSWQPIARGVFGFDFAISKMMAAILRLDYNRSLNHESYTTAGGTYLLFGDIFDAGIGLLLRF